MSMYPQMHPAVPQPHEWHGQQQVNYYGANAPPPPQPVALWPPHPAASLQVAPANTWHHGHTGTAPPQYFGNGNGYVPHNGPSAWGNSMAPVDYTAPPHNMYHTPIHNHIPPAQMQVQGLYHAASAPNLHTYGDNNPAPADYNNTPVHNQHTAPPVQPPNAQYPAPVHQHHVTKNDKMSVKKFGKIAIAIIVANIISTIIHTGRSLYYFILYSQYSPLSPFPVSFYVFNACSMLMICADIANIVFIRHKMRKALMIVVLSINCAYVLLHVYGLYSTFGTVLFIIQQRYYSVDLIVWTMAQFVEAALVFVSFGMKIALIKKWAAKVRP